jgi:hypothetical protein
MKKGCLIASQMLLRIGQHDPKDTLDVLASLQSMHTPRRHDMEGVMLLGGLLLHNRATTSQLTLPLTVAAAL